MDAKCSNKLTYLSFILAVGIIIRHSSCVGYQSLSSVHLWIERFVSDATDMIVPMFFAISGFLFFKNFDYSKLIQKWTSRIHSLLIPFVIWSFAGFLFFYLIGKIPFIASNTDMVPGNIEIWPLLKDIFINTKYNTTWFVLNLMIYVLVVPILKPLMDKKLAGGYFADNHIIGVFP